MSARATNLPKKKAEFINLGFYLSDNSKLKFKPNHRNTFGLNFGLPENGGTCPGATRGPGGCLDVRTGCKRETCYMAKVVQIYKGVGARLADNTKLVLGKSIEEMAKVMRASVQFFVDTNEEKDWYFRLHYSGDFFSKDYAKAWALVVNEFPKVKFWVYTRSFHLVQYLVDSTNLTIMLSIDPVNKQQGLELAKLYETRPNIGLAWLGKEKPEGIRWVTCPETSGVLKNTKDKGACATCRLCIDRYKTKVKNIQFVIH